MLKLKKPLVSVIIPNYNHACYLEQRLESVYNQTYSNFEVIILDDCSFDNSLEIINRYKDNPHTVHIVVNETNSGSPFKQWNKGIGLAKGELIWIAESDDFCELNLLEELVGAYTCHPNVVLAYAPVVFTNEQGEEIRSYSIEGRTKLIKGGKFIVNYLLFENTVHNASCAIFSRHAAMTVDPIYMKYSGVGDWWLWMLISEQGDVAIVNKHLSYFRRHEGSVTNKLTISGCNSRGFFDIFQYIKRRYFISRLREDYILFSQPWLVYGAEDIEVQKELKQLWNYDRKFSRFERFVFRCVSHLRRRYLLYL